MISIPEETNTGPSLPSEPELSAETSQSSDKPKKKGKKKISKGVETLFRTTLTNHLKLSEMADSKANLMISVNTIIIPIVISAYVREAEGGKLLIPTLLLLLVSLTTIVVALIATNPTIKSKPTESTPDDPPQMDLLFFGDYTKISAQEYRERVQKLINDDERLYNSMIDNVYAQGKVLARKYRLLKFAYRFFMVGFSLAVISYAIAIFLFS